MNLVQTTPPAIEPVTRAEAKRFARITTDVDDDLVDNLITAARLGIEAWTGLQLITATWKLLIDGFPSSYLPDDSWRFPGVRAARVTEIVLPRPPLLSVTSVKYIDLDGVQQTLATTWTADTVARPGRILLDYGEAWPSIRRQPNAVEIIYQAGFGNAVTDVPENVKLALKMLLNDAYEHRDYQSELKVERNQTAVDLLADQMILEAG
jgi:uncharacterized phiE125 gp8 family phage protein